MSTHAKVNLRKKLKNRQLRIEVGLQFGSEVCKMHKCLCRKDFAEEGWCGLSCIKNADKLFRHSKLNALLKQILSPIPSVLEPRHIYRTDQKRPDNLTSFALALGNRLLSAVTVKDFLAPSRRKKRRKVLN